MKKLSFYEAPASLYPNRTSQVNIDFLQAKNIFLSGEFLPMGINSFKENLIKRQANVQPEITPETEILICGKYPDWILVEEATLYGIKIIFVDKAGELFNRIAAKLIKNKTDSPVKELMEA
ncbi:hypothetical protein GILI108418_06045 [Gillisia limnaea]|uniref:Uncharacterized protein n=2 Tax=Gillisia TaxID=244698 RepID=H2BT04_GILLR|nr:hypothetical protein Gilli_0837 [Gillisia limnaea DSM 15749]